MKIVRLVGRLGNQMFIYAFAKALEYYTGDEVFFDVSAYTSDTRDSLQLDKVFDIDLNIIPYNKIPLKYKESPFLKIPFIKNHKKIFALFHLKSKSYITEGNMVNRYCPELLKIKKDAYYSGFFQCEQYFKSIEAEIRKDFSFRPVEDSSLIKKRKEIEQYECPIFINIRRGDYVSLKENNVVDWLCDMSYYRKATDFMKKKFPNCTFIAVSDEPDWLVENLKIDYPFKIYSSNTPYMDIYLLQACKHGICANSSYSWWAAWLIENKDKVIIAPEPWFEVGRKSDIIPDEWIKIPRLG